MTRSSSYVLALVLSATPLLLVGCGDSDSKTDASSGGEVGAIKHDSGATNNLDAGTPDVGTLDVTPSTIDTAPATLEVGVSIDTLLVADTAGPDVPVLPDTPILSDTHSGDDVAAPDTPILSDTHSGDDVAAPDVLLGLDAPILINNDAPTVDAGAVDTTAVDTAPIDTAPAGLAVVTLTGDACNISTATHWTPAIYVAVDCDIEVSSALQIDPGTIIKFGPARGMDVTSTGQITATGTTLATIVFTSLKDDAHGGDTNGDADATSAAGADWTGLTLQASGSTFNHCEFYFAGASASSALTVGNETSKVTVTNSIFAHNLDATDAITAAPALNATYATAGTVITGNTFYDNRVPLAINTTFSIDDSNSFGNSTGVLNKYNGIIVNGCGEVKSSIIWAATKVPFVIGDPLDACNHLTVDAAAHLTLADNVVVKFFSQGSIVVNGSLTATAIDGKTIVFTSIHDDANGGDTNGDATATTPAGNDWAGVSVAAAGSAFDRCQFLYGGSGGNGDGSVLATTAVVAVSVKDSVFAHNKPATLAINAPAALDLSSAATGTVVTGNTFYDNTVPLAIGTTFSLDDSNTFVDSARTLPNKYNGINVAGCGTVTSALTWSATKVPLVIGDPTSACVGLSIGGAGHLTLGDSVIMKFFTAGRLTVETNATLTLGTGDIFTSIKDDTQGGDTNADAADTAPAANDWYGIVEGSTCKASTSTTSILYNTPPASDGTCP